MPNEINESKSLSSVLNYVHHNMGDNFIVLSSAFTSAKKHKNFKFARRVMEAFEMMQSCLPEIRSLAGNKKSIMNEYFVRKMEILQLPTKKLVLQCSSMARKENLVIMVIK